MSKKAGMTWIPILNVIMGAVAALGFFLPFVTVLFFNVSGYDYATLGGFPALFIIPVGGIVALLFGLLAMSMKGKTKMFGWLVR